MISRLFLIAACMFTVPAYAQDAKPQNPRALSEAEVQAKYQNCPNGYYSGPRPGKARYTKDNFIWAVTPEFARKFCMPPEFVSNELKGAEAVAFRIVEDADEERCGWGGRAEVCGRMKELRFEIYLDASVKLPKKNDLRTAVMPSAPSSRLISFSPQEFDRRYQESRARGFKLREGQTFPAFDTTQFGLDGFRGSKVIWPIVTLYEQVYHEDHLRDINYLSLQGSTGFFTNPRMEKLDVRRFAIVVRKLSDTKKSDGRPLSEYAHVIELPESFTDKVRAADRARGMNVEELGKRALGIK